MLVSCLFSPYSIPSPIPLPLSSTGIVKAAKEVGLRVPLVVRLEGTNVEQGKALLNSSGIQVITANDLDDAAKKAVATLK